MLWSLIDRYNKIGRLIRFGPGRNATNRVVRSRYETKDLRYAKTLSHLGRDVRAHTLIYLIDLAFNSY